MIDSWGNVRWKSTELGIRGSWTQTAQGRQTVSVMIGNGQSARSYSDVLIFDQCDEAFSSWLVLRLTLVLGHIEN